MNTHTHTHTHTHDHVRVCACRMTMDGRATLSMSTSIIAETRDQATQLRADAVRHFGWTVPSGCPPPRVAFLRREPERGRAIDNELQLAHIVHSMTGFWPEVCDCCWLLVWVCLCMCVCVCVCLCGWSHNCGSTNSFSRVRVYFPIAEQQAYTITAADSLREQARFFRSFGIIVASHSSQLVNMIFAHVCTTNTSTQQCS